MFYECLNRPGNENRNSVLNRVGKSAIFVLNRVYEGPGCTTQGYIEVPPGLRPKTPWTKTKTLWTKTKTPVD